jgi:hypothetical protein
MLSLTGGLGEGAAEAVTVVVGAFMAAEAFMARVGSQAFIAGAGSQAFTGAILVAFMAGVSGTFTAIVFSAVIVSSFPVSMGTRGGGIGVILIIGVTHIIRIIRITLTSSQITQDRTIVTTCTTTIRTTELVVSALARAFHSR